MLSRGVLTFIVALVASPLADLRAALASSSSSDSPSTIQHNVTVPLPGTPHLLSFTHDSTRLLVAFTNGALNVYDAHAIFQGTAMSALHTFPSPNGRAVRDIFPSTGEPEHVAVLREPGDGLTVEILDVGKMASLGGWNAGGSPGTNPTTRESCSALKVLTVLTCAFSIVVTQREANRHWVGQW